MRKRRTDADIPLETKELLWDQYLPVFVYLLLSFFDLALSVSTHEEKRMQGESIVMSLLVTFGTSIFLWILCTLCLTQTIPWIVVGIMTLVVPVYMTLNSFTLTWDAFLYRQ